MNTTLGFFESWFTFVMCSCDYIIDQSPESSECWLDVACGHMLFAGSIFAHLFFKLRHKINASEVYASNWGLFMLMQGRFNDCLESIYHVWDLYAHILVDDKLQNFKSGEIQDSSKFKFKYKSKLGFPTAWHKACKPIRDLAISLATTQSHPHFIPILPSLT